MNVDIYDNLHRAIGKQRLLFMAVCSMNTAAIGAKLRDDEMTGLMGCIAETIDLIQQVIDGDVNQN